MKITDEAVEACSVSVIGAPWATFDEGLRNTLRGIHREALEAALPHLEGATPVVDREALERLIESADHYDTCSSMLSPDAGYGCSCLLADLRALIGGAS